MSNLLELTDLFARLASQTNTRSPKTNSDEQSDDVLVAALNQSLNLREQTRVRVLDTALSLMCFTGPQVFDSVIDCSVNTIVSILSSSADCKVLRFGKAEVLRIGGSISVNDCVGVMESCADVLGKLNENADWDIWTFEAMLSRSLLYAVVRVAVMATQFRYTMQLTPVLDVQPTDGRNHALSKLVGQIRKRISLENQELQLRLLFWYLDPQILVEDVSQVLQDAIHRPFLCLTGELYEKMEWRSIIICLALSPVMLIETMALLHNWFLLTGVASVLELQVELISMVLDLLSRPMWWGLSTEVGSKLPFSYAYFLFKHRLFRTLAVPLSCGGFLELVHKIKKYVSHAKRSSHPTIKHATTTSMVDHKSTWAMAMNFPDWFYFASGLLLSEKSFRESYMSTEDEDIQPQTSCSAAAAWYIAWILDPVDELVCGLLAEKLENLSRTLISMHLDSYDQKERTGAFEIKLKKRKPNAKVLDDTSQKYTCQTLWLWLEEFQDVACYYGRSNGSSKSQIETIHLQNNMMFRRITLGILIGCPSSINEDGCELLLHYVATGRILHLTENQHAGLKHRRWNCEWQENLITCVDESSRKEAIAGARIVFHLTDIAERMSYSIFKTREIAVDFICQIKLRIVKYLLKCVKRLLQFETDQNNHLSVKDLHKRMLRWRHQGRDVFHGYKDLDDAINLISCKVP